MDAACQAIRPSSLVPDRRLVAVQEGRAERIVVQPSPTERAEAELVVKTLERLVGGTSSFSFNSGRVGYGDTPNLSFKDVAVLYRTEAQTPALIEALSRAGIPYQKRSHRPLLDQPGVQALVTSLQRRAGEVASSGIERFLDQLVLGLAMTTSGTSQDLETILSAVELVRPLALRVQGDLERFVTELALGGEVDLWDPRAEGISLLTLHASKGLEFPVVFLVGCEDGLLPMSWPGTREAEIAEERRLFFVGMTRARSRLFLLHSRKRSLRGETSDCRPSPFLDDIAEELLERREVDLPPPRPRQMRLV